MKRLAVNCAVLLCLLCVVRDAAAKDAWYRVRSENFTVVGDTGEDELRRVAVQLEQFRRALAELLLGAAHAMQGVPTVVIVFKSDDSYRPFQPLYQGRPSEVGGYFQPGRDTNYITVSAGNARASFDRAIFHEYVHLFVNENLRGLPLCLNEGLAEYYSTISISDKGRRVTLGAENRAHANLLRHRELLPLAQLLGADETSPAYNEGERRRLFYAQSWVLAHYLMDGGDGRRLNRFARLLELEARGATVSDGFKEAFQQSAASVETSLREYVRRGNYTNSIAVFAYESVADQRWRGETLTEARALGYLGDLLLHINRMEDAEAYLQSALALDPNQSAALVSLGMLQLKQQRREEAARLLRRAVTADAQNHLAQYGYAYALSREGTGENIVSGGYPPETMERMRAALQRTMQLAPAFVEAYRLQAFISFAQDERLDEAVALLKRALALAPSRWDVALLLARVNLHRGEFAEARDALAPIVRRATDRPLREEAQTLLVEITEAEALASSRTAFAGNEFAGNDATGAQPFAPAASPATEPAVAAKPTLLKRFTGERVRGLLTRIVCADDGVSLFVKTGERTLRLHGEELRRIFFLTYLPGAEREIGCGARQPASLVVLTYRPSAATDGKYDGVAVAVEFVPEDIEIEP